VALLYSYCIPFDDGAAPNPYWGLCTLAICKPVIRRNASVGDWVVGTGSKKHHMENKVIYAMKITDVMTLAEYNDFCLLNFPNKIPDMQDKNLAMRAGDCIYYYESGRYIQRKGVHNDGNYSTDTNGKNVLLSDHFFYFGDKPVDLPKDLHPIVKQSQGHKSIFNNNYMESFITWIETSLETKPYLNQLKSQPHLLKDIFENLDTEDSASCRNKCSREDETADDKGF
jgi:hypothetical protein